MRSRTRALGHRVVAQQESRATSSKSATMVPNAQVEDTTGGWASSVGSSECAVLAVTVVGGVPDPGLPHAYHDYGDEPAPP